MDNSTKTGIWSKASGKNLSFELEVKRGLEITADWKPGIGGKQIDVSVGKIDGHWTPAWGSDDHWIYLKRPEGVWKFKRKHEIAGDWLMITQCVNGHLLPGSLTIEFAQLGLGGWQWDGETALSSDRLDALIAPGKECPLTATEMWAPLYDVVDHSADKVVVNAGEAFNTPLVESTVSGNWVLVKDPAKNRIAAFDMSKSKAVRDGAAAGKLWLRFCGSWMEPIEVRVKAS